MASVIKLKRSSNAGSIPASGDLEVGEIALNLADRVIYSKNNAGNIIRLGEAELANTNAYIANVDSRLVATNTALRNLINTAQTAADQGLADVQSTNNALRILINTAQTAADQGLADVQSSNTALRNLINTAQTAADQGLADVQSSNTTLRNLISTAQTAADQGLADVQSSNTALRNLINAAQTAADQGLADVQSTNNALRILISAADDKGTQALADVQSSNTALRNLIDAKAPQSELDAQELKQAQDLANTNLFIHNQLANTNLAIGNLSTTLSGDFMVKTNPQSSGHFQHTGNTSITANLQVSGNTTINGNLTVEGDVAYVSTTNIEVTDPLMKLAADNSSSDVVDTGFFALYENAGANNFAGIFRDATDGVFKVFKDSQSQPTTTVDTGAAGYTLAQLDALIDGGSF
jgi:hypothetical protein